MKKFLSLLLALLFCLSFIVSCEKEEAPSTSSSSEPPSSSIDIPSSSESEGLIIDGTVAEYYYKSQEFKLREGREKSNIYLATDKEHLLEIFETLTDEPVNDFMREECYEDNYIFVIEECGERGIWSELLGCRDLTKTEDGYYLVRDILRDNNHYWLNEDGEAVYGQILPEPPELYTLKAPYVCYAIVIPRSEFEEEPSAYDIKIKQVIYDRINPERY